MNIQIPEEAQILFMNKTALEQILVNLIQNAVKYNDKENPILRSGFQKMIPTIYFTVKDNGKGIAPEEQEKIFELFTTLGPARPIRHSGYGHWTFTVKKLVEKLSGTIVPEIRSWNEGSEFSFSIKKQTSFHLPVYTTG